MESKPGEDDGTILRRTVLKTAGAIGAAGALAGCSSGDGNSSPTNDSPSGTQSENGGDESPNLNSGVTTIAGIHSAMADGTMTAEDLTQHYLDRINAYNEDLNAFIHVNEDALSRAKELDQMLEESGPVGPMHGIPLVLKDNFDTGDMPTTGASETLEGVVPPDDATTVRRFREAGAIVLGKANMQEFAYGGGTFSSMGGQTPNPYDLSRVPGGSSGGSAASVAANLAAIGTGSDTLGSVRLPAAVTNTVGVRGTLGLISRDGIMPMSERQDIGGPITRTVADAARMLDVMVGYDSADPSTARTVGNVPVGDEPPVTTALGDGATDSGSYTDSLDEDALDGSGIGIIRDYIQEEGERQTVATVVETAIDDIEEAGARIVDPVDVPPADTGVSLTEFNREMNDYLSTLDDPNAPDDLEAIISQPDNVHPGVMPALEASAAVSVEDIHENVEYLQSLVARDYYRTMNSSDTEQGNKQQLLAEMAENDLDALLYPIVSAPPAEIPDADGEYPSQPGVNAELSAGTGLPAITVPGGFTEDGLPVGIELIGRPFDEETLISLGYAYEQATGHRRSPEQFGAI